MASPIIVLQHFIDERKSLRLTKLSAVAAEGVG
jgi:hypothetical protein